MGKRCEVLLDLGSGGNRQNSRLLALTLLSLVVDYLRHMTILQDMMSIDNI